MTGKQFLLFGLLMEMFKGRMEEHGRHKLCIQILTGPLGGHGPQMTERLAHQRSEGWNSA